MNFIAQKLNCLLPQNISAVKKYTDAFLALKSRSNNESAELINKFLALNIIWNAKKNFFLNLTDCQSFIGHLQSCVDLDALDVTFFKLLYERKKLGLLATICLQIAKSLLAEQNQTLFIVSTSTSLDAQAKDSVIKFLLQRSHNPLVIFQHDPALISGIKITSDCFLYEKSIKSRINGVMLTLKTIAK